jgi:hypothetical protein
MSDKVLSGEECGLVDANRGGLGRWDSRKVARLYGVDGLANVRQGPAQERIQWLLSRTEFRYFGKQQR